MPDFSNHIGSPFLLFRHDVVRSLHAAGVHYVDDYKRLAGEAFDLYFDCGAELFHSLGRPVIGAIELTGSGDALYRRQSFPLEVITWWFISEKEFAEKNRA